MKVQITKTLLENNEIYKYFIANKHNSQRVRSVGTDPYRMEVEIELINDEQEGFLDTIENLQPYKYMLSPNTLLFGPVMYIEERTVYLGEYKDNKREGQGLQIFEDGSLYEGQFTDDQAKGHGRIIFEEGDIYEGEIDNFEMHGLGFYHRAIGDKMKGYFYRDHPHGKMEVEYKDGARFKGEYVNGKKNGFGLFVFADGTFYEGEFKDDFFQGKGTFTNNQDGTKFEGLWESNILQSPAKIKYNDGSVYEGGVDNYQKHGNGTLIKDNKKYTGKWKNDLLEGIVYIENLNDFSKRQAIYRNGNLIEYMDNRNTLSDHNRVDTKLTSGENKNINLNEPNKIDYNNMRDANNNLNIGTKQNEKPLSENTILKISNNDIKDVSKKKKKRGFFLCF